MKQHVTEDIDEYVKRLQRELERSKRNVNYVEAVVSDYDDEWNDINWTMDKHETRTFFSNDVHERERLESEYNELLDDIKYVEARREAARERLDELVHVTRKIRAALKLANETREAGYERVDEYKNDTTLPHLLVESNNYGDLRNWITP